MKPYLPLTGSEGMIFEEKWCEQCINHSINPDAKKQCIHLLRALCGENNGRWVLNGVGEGECIAFRSRKEAYKNRKRVVRKDKNQLQLGRSGEIKDGKLRKQKEKKTC